MYSIGEKVRVTVAPGRTRRGIVACIGSSKNLKAESESDVIESIGGVTSYKGIKGEHTPTYDVLLLQEQQPPVDSKAKSTSEGVEIPPENTTGTEMSGILGSDMSRLQPFELDGTIERLPDRALPTAELTVLAEDLKEKGNVLFKLGDVEAAAEIFDRVLALLEPPPTVGSTVLVRVRTNPAEPGGVRYRSAMVADADADGRSFDVIYDSKCEVSGKAGGGDHTTVTAAERDEDEMEEECSEEDGVAEERVLSVSVAPCVSCATRLNLARCWFKGDRHPEVVEVCTVVIRQAKLAMSDKGRSRDEKVKLRTHCLTALRVRGKSHLAQNHVGLARKDVRTMARSVWDADGKAQATRFEAEVERKAKALLKANRKLAKDVTRWVDASMAIHEAGHEEKEKDAIGGGGVEESKGGDSANGIGGGEKSWLGSWFR